MCTIDNDSDIILHQFITAFKVNTVITFVRKCFRDSRILSEVDRTFTDDLHVLGITYSKTSKIRTWIFGNTRWLEIN